MKDERVTEEQKAAAKADAIRRLQPKNEHDMLSQVTGDFDDNVEDIINPELKKCISFIRQDRSRSMYHYHGRSR